MTGSDARFPSKVRQIDVIGLCYVLICNQEVAGSIPVRSIRLQIAGSVWGLFPPELGPFLLVHRSLLMRHHSQHRRIIGLLVAPE